MIRRRIRISSTNDTKKRRAVVNFSTPFRHVFVENIVSKRCELSKTRFRFVTEMMKETFAGEIFNTLPNFERTSAERSERLTYARRRRISPRRESKLDDVALKITARILRCVYTRGVGYVAEDRPPTRQHVNGIDLEIEHRLPYDGRFNRTDSCCLSRGTTGVRARRHESKLCQLVFSFDTN